jgi:hypothetical protein
MQTPLQTQTQCRTRRPHCRPHSHLETTAPVLATGHGEQRGIPGGGFAGRGA